MGKIDILPIKIQKLFLQGKIDAVYERMYNLAEKLAVHEVKLYQSLLTTRLLKKSENQNKDLMGELLDKVAVYRQKRIQFHINEMKELLKLREEVKK